ncbi:ABC transporter substrate-binding protein [Ochrovirga pacifica]|uniref:ABC transporter substrate-binding protein n=1 Tax=Ochrovirga pacifica TaxID=1042376 RepID=UPI0002557C0F|nr:helical backbone metal receptor [Ochrovirga pacifica]
MTFIDDLGNVLSFERRNTKIVSLVPSITETLYDLNLEEFIVGVTKFCISPPHFKHVKNIVGGTKDADIEKIKALKPDLVFCNKEENTPEIVEQLKTFTQVFVTQIESVEDTIRMIQNIGVILNRRTEGDLLIRKIELKQKEFINFMQQYQPKKVAYFIWYKPWMVAAEGTYINHLLDLCKYENIYQNLTQYPEIDPKRIRYDGDPEVLFFSSEPFPFQDKHAFEISEYTNRSSAVFVDGEMFSWFGSRLLKSFDYFKALRQKLEGASF